MRRFSAVVFSAVALAAACCAMVAGSALPAGASQPAAGIRGLAQAVPGLAPLSGYSQINSVSCGSAGNCAAGGTYADSSGVLQGFVVDETGGSWGMAQEVPGLAALNAGGAATVLSVSCPSAGNCAAGGWYYASADSGSEAFVVDETGGSWGKAQEVPGLAALNPGGFSISSVSCASAGNCAAVGYYYTTVSDELPFVVDETGGSWGKAQEISGTAAVGPGPDAVAQQVTCPSAGNCVATGEIGYFQPTATYPPGTSFVNQGFVAEESDGSWGKAEPVPGVAPGSTPGGSSVSLSCWSAGNCAAVVSYTDSSGGHQGLVNETDGSWGTPQAVPGLAAPVDSVSCGSAGNCAIAGTGFVAAESGGSWGTVQQVPGLAGGYTVGPSVSCGAAGTCAATGTYIYTQEPSQPDQAFAVAESGGSWGTVQEIPTTADLDGITDIFVSCPPAGNCTAAGYGRGKAFVVDETAGFWGTAQAVPGMAALNASENTTSTDLTLTAAKVTYGQEQAERVSVTVSAPSGGTPTGTVTVTAGTNVLCGSITLAAGRASCLVGATRLPAGTWQLTASYTGTDSLQASSSAASTLTVAKAASTVTLRLSAVKVTYGHEGSERLTVRVTGQYAGTPAGKVTVKSGKIILCTVTLTAGQGSCVLTARKLPVGTRTLVAVYGGNSDFTGAASARKTLKVVN